jgi:hypothetical protein
LCIIRIPKSTDERYLLMPFPENEFGYCDVASQLESFKAW